MMYSDQSFKGGNMETYCHAEYKLQDANIPKDLSDQLLSLHNYMNELSNGKADRICIFGAGEYGIRLYQELRSKLIPVHRFSDNNEGKWGFLFDNVNCISPKQLEAEKDRTLVIVANRSPVEIINQLRSHDFPYISTKQEIDKVLIHTPAVEWMTVLNNIENLDFSSKEVLLLLNKFNQTIFDICKYYESKI